jgi:hypothetical protein
VHCRVGLLAKTVQRLGSKQAAICIYRSRWEQSAAWAALYAKRRDFHRT